MIIVDAAKGIHVVKKTPAGYYTCDQCHNSFTLEELMKAHDFVNPNVYKGWGLGV
jgi:hypothetical protein